MAKPIVAIIGKPNVGKSTFFNYIIGKRISIVEDVPGVTRDRVYGEANWRGRNFTLIDTGGIEPKSDDIILSQMKEQADIAISIADVIIFITDIRQGITAADQEIALMLKKSKKPIVLVCNKSDNVGETSNDIYEFYNLGIGEPYPVSSTNALGIGDVLDAVYEHFPEKDETEDEDEIINVAVIGKPNVGKSSLINKILGENRVMVSNIAGTTRDAIDSYFENKHGKYNFIDTAGIRRKSKTTESIEKFSIMRSLLAIERADICLLLIDANEGVTDQDAKIAGEAHEAGKGIIIVVNKWDEVEKTTGTLEKYTKEVFPDISLNDFLSSAIKGEIDNKGLLKQIILLFGDEIVDVIYLLGSIIVVIIIHSILKAFTENLENESVSQITYYIQYILIVTLIMANFSTIISGIKDSIANLTGFINCLVPILLALMSATRECCIC